MLRPGDTIEYLEDVSSPPSQKGIRGQTKVIAQDISMWTTKFLLSSGKVRPFDPASPLQLEEEETEKGPGKKERRTKKHEPGKKDSATAKASDHKPKKPNPKGRA